MYGSRYTGYNYSPLVGLEESMKKSTAKTTATPANKAATSSSSTLVASNQMKASSARSSLNSSMSSASISSMTTNQTSQKRMSVHSNAASPGASATPHALLTFKNNLFGELTRAIQLVNASTFTSLIIMY